MAKICSSQMRPKFYMQNKTSNQRKIEAHSYFTTHQSNAIQSLIWGNTLKLDTLCQILPSSAIFKGRINPGLGAEMCKACRNIPKKGITVVGAVKEGSKNNGAQRSWIHICYDQISIFMYTFYKSLCKKVLNVQWWLQSLHINVTRCLFLVNTDLMLK